MSNPGKVNPSDAETILEGIRDNLLKPMHDSINKYTENQIGNVVKDLNDIKESLNKQQERDNSFIAALKNLKWND